MEWELLRGVDDDAVRSFLAGARRRRFSRREVIFHEGDPADTLHLIDRGRVMVRVTTTSGETTSLGLRGPGEVVGELALIGPPVPRVATVVALEPTETRAVGRSDFERLLMAQPRVLEVLVRILAERVRELTSQVLEARYVPADVRIRRRILELTDAGGGRSGASQISLTQEDLAGWAGTTRGTVNRVLREEVQLGTLTTARGRISVVNRDSLVRRADQPT